MVTKGFNQFQGQDSENRFENKFERQSLFEKQDLLFQLIQFQLPWQLNQPEP